MRITKLERDAEGIWPSFGRETRARYFNWAGVRLAARMSFP